MSSLAELVPLVLILLVLVVQAPSTVPASTARSRDLPVQRHRDPGDLQYVCSSTSFLADTGEVGTLTNFRTLDAMGVYEAPQS